MLRLNPFAKVFKNCRDLLQEGENEVKVLFILNFIYNFRFESMAT